MQALASKLGLALCLFFASAAGALELESGAGLSALYEAQISRRLAIPEDEQQRYAQLLEEALAGAGLRELSSQYFMLVDRDAMVQAAMIFWRSPAGRYVLIGASPASTGRPGEFEHFTTPVGVFDHDIGHLDFRAEGTRNDNGIRGYGVRGMRVFDFGWVMGQRGWGRGGESPMRLQMHATDPDILERQLGCVHSKGCIRIPAALDRFLDHYGILDADYERAVARGQHFWVLPRDREPTPWSGRYLVVVDTDRTTRPAWSHAPPGPPC
jgi:hypothetical protein